MQFPNLYDSVQGRALFFEPSLQPTRPEITRQEETTALLPPSKGVKDVETFIFDYLPIKAIGNCALVSKNWHQAAGGTAFEEHWKKALFLIEYQKRSDTGPYHDFCLAALTLKRLASNRSHVQEIRRLFASLFLQRISMRSWEEVESAVNLITSPQKRRLGWYEVALQRIQNREYEEAKKIADEKLKGHVCALQIRNRVLAGLS